jgi:hypothetical protein
MPSLRSGVNVFLQLAHRFVVRITLIGLRRFV